MSLLPRLFTIRTACVLTAAIAALTSVVTLQAEPAFFMGLGNLGAGYSGHYSYPSGISADGSVVVGVTAPLNSEAFRWTRDGGLIGLGNPVGWSNANGVSADGLTIIGEDQKYVNGGGDTNYYPFRWTQAEGRVALDWGSIEAYATGISGDGSVIVGKRYLGIGTGRPHLAFEWIRWTQSGGVEVLRSSNSDPQGATGRTYISSDASVILGTAANETPRLDFLWTAATGIEPLPNPESGRWTLVTGLSGDGKTVIGRGRFGGEPERAIRWTKETGAEALPPLANGDIPIGAQGVSADGSVIVGQIAQIDPLTGYRYFDEPFIWDAAHGSRKLSQVLIDEYYLGNSLTGWLLGGSLSISADGRTIVGGGLNPAGIVEGWIAHLGPPVPEPNTLALAALASAGCGWRRRKAACARLGRGRCHEEESSHTAPSL